MSAAIKARAALAKRHCAGTGLGVGRLDRVFPDVAPAQIEHFALAASGQRQQPDRGDGLGPLGLAGVERAPKPCQLVRVEEAGDVAPWVLAAACVKRETAATREAPSVARTRQPGIREDQPGLTGSRRGSEGGAAGVDGETVQRIKTQAVERWLGELARDLKEGSYRPGAVRQVLIPKKQAGKYRPLGIPCVRDRVAQSAAPGGTGADL